MRILKKLILIIFVLIGKNHKASCLSNDSIKDLWRPYFGASKNISTFNSLPFVWRNPQTIGSYSALPVEDFSNNRKSLAPLLTKYQYSIFSGTNYHFSKNSIVGAELRFNQLTNSGNEKTIVLSDQVDPVKGYTLGTNHQVKHFFYAYRSISLGLSYQIEQDFGSWYHHRIGFKFQAERLINSAYEIKTTMNEQHYFYFNSDLKWSDKIWNFYPFLHYELLLHSKKSRQLWLCADYSTFNIYFPQNLVSPTYQKKSLNLLAIGIKIEFKKKTM